MSGWLLFFLFLFVVGFPTRELDGRSTPTQVAAYIAWAIGLVALVGAALRTGGYL